MLCALPQAGVSLEARLDEALQIRSLLLRNTEELDGVVAAMAGRYVLPEAGGDLLRDGKGVLPTGRGPALRCYALCAECWGGGAAGGFMPPTRRGPWVGRWCLEEGPSRHQGVRTPPAVGSKRPRLPPPLVPLPGRTCGVPGCGPGPQAPRCSTVPLALPRGRGQRIIMLLPGLASMALSRCRSNDYTTTVSLPGAQVAVPVVMLLVCGLRRPVPVAWCAPSQRNGWCSWPPSLRPPARSLLSG